MFQEERTTTRHHQQGATPPRTFRPRSRRTDAHMHSQPKEAVTTASQAVQHHNLCRLVPDIQDCRNREQEHNTRSTPNSNAYDLPRLSTTRCTVQAQGTLQREQVPQVDTQQGTGLLKDGSYRTEQEYQEPAHQDMRDTLHRPNSENVDRKTSHQQPSSPNHVDLFDDISYVLPSRHLLSVPPGYEEQGQR